MCLEYDGSEITNNILVHALIVYSEKVIMNPLLVCARYEDQGYNMLGDVYIWRISSKITLYDYVAQEMGI